MRLLIGAGLMTLIPALALTQDAPKTEAPSFSRPALGDFWYGMYLPDGKTEGYARIHLRETKTGGLHCDWELHIAFAGGSYEEERKISFDDQWGMNYTEFESGDNRTLAAREGKVMVGRQNIDELRAEVADDAMTGMGFILAACTTLKAGTAFTRTEYNEAAGLKEQGTTTFNVGAEEEIELPEGRIKAHKITMQRSEKGRALPIWVNAKREIVQVDWGTNNLMKLHREKTTGLFNPTPPAVKDLDPDNPNLLTVGGDFHGFTVEEMWAHWTTNDGMAKWWPQEADIEAKVGGKFIMKWKTPEGEPAWTLLGEIKALEVNKKLTFSWKWEQMPEEELEVTVELAKVEGGVNLKITHGKYKDAEQKKSSGHLQGWQHFCTKLAALKK